MDKKDLYGQLLEAFENVKPDDADDVEDMEEIEALNPETDEEYEEAIQLLAHFLGDWFPDEEDEETLEEYRNLLEEAENRN